MQCNGIEGLYAKLTGEDLSLLYIYIYIYYIYIYIYIYIYRCSVMVCKASMIPIDWAGSISLLYIYTSCNMCYARMCMGGTTSWKSHML